MNTRLPVTNSGPWPIAPYGAEDGPVRAGRNYSATNLLDFATLVRIVSDWRWVIASAVGFGFAMGILTVLLTHPVYRAWVTVEVNPPMTPVSDNRSDQAQSESVSNYDLVATEVGLIKSRSVAQRAAQELNLPNNPAVVPPNTDASRRLDVATNVVSAGIHADMPEQGQLIKFSVDSTSPQFAASIANSVGDGLINTELQRRYEASAYARAFLERQIARTRHDLENSERGLVTYAQQQGIINTADPNAQGGGGDTNSLQGESLVKLNEALAEATARRVATEGAYRSALASGPTADVTQSTQSLQLQLSQATAEYEQKRTFLKPDHPDMISLHSRINELQRQISNVQRQVNAGNTNQLLAQYRAAVSAENALKARVGQLKGDVLNLRGRSIQYTILQRDVDTNRALYDALLQRYKQIGVAGGVGLAPVSIVDRADVPQSPVKPNLIFDLLIGSLLGLIGGLASAVALEFVNDTIKSREDVRQKLSLPCLGAIPRTIVKNAFVEELKNPGSIVSEAYSAAVAALRFSTESGMPKVLLVTSTRPGEGKSSTALALAQNFARRGRSVLLVDSDLRKPAFKAANEDVGLSKLLTTDEGIDKHILDTQHADLSLLPSGPTPPNPADLLSGGRIRSIISEAVERFDFVVVDGPPTMGLADSALLGAACANALFVIEAGSTRTRSVIEALNHLEATGTHILGAVLTKTNEAIAGYSYGRYGYRAAVPYGQGKENLAKKIFLFRPSEEEADPNDTQESGT